jgi:hypothetical protein
MIETAAGSLADAGATRRYEADPEYSYSSDEFARRVHRYPADVQTRARSSSPSRTPRARTPAAGGHPLVGVRVRHPNYGVGTIIDVDGEDDDRKLTVSFSDHGTKKLVERFANLTRA